LWKVSAIDLNPIALQVTQENAELNGVVIDVRKADMLSGLSDSGERYEIILSNPPYIPYSDRGFMQPHVVDFEPHDALFVPDDDPLLFYKAIVQIAVGHLEKNGLVAVEIQEKFGVPVQQLFEKAGLKSVDILRDLDGKDRIVGGKK
jgi:release factor glutamine methyltransferase